MILIPTEPAAIILQGSALDLSDIPDGSIDEADLSPPYYNQRKYPGAGNGQIGNELTPQEYLAHLCDVMKQLWPKLRPGGSVFVNLGDKRKGSGGPGTTSGLGGTPQGNRYNSTEGVHKTYGTAGLGRRKSLMALPQRFVVACVDGFADPEGIGWIWRDPIVWEKENCLPESVRDRCRSVHEDIYHFTKNPVYYSAVDEIRERPKMRPQRRSRRAPRQADSLMPAQTYSTAERGHTGTDSHPLGSLPGDVWRLPSEPLRLPDYFVELGIGGEWEEFWVGKPAKPKELGELLDSLDVPFTDSDPVYPGLVAMWRLLEDRFRQGMEDPVTAVEVDHYAAWPSELPRRMIQGWCPPAICLECGEGRFPVTDVEQERYRPESSRDGWSGRHPGGPRKDDQREDIRTVGATILGYACACTPYTDHPGTGKKTPTAKANGRQGDRPMDIEANHEDVGPWREYHIKGWDAPPTRAAVVLDVCGGTGTTAMVAKALGRVGISLDLSPVYCRLAEWRCNRSGHWKKAVERTWAEAQQVLL